MHQRQAVEVAGAGEAQHCAYTMTGGSHQTGPWWHLAVTLAGHAMFLLCLTPSFLGTACRHLPSRHLELSQLVSKLGYAHILLASTFLILQLQNSMQCRTTMHTHLQICLADSCGTPWSGSGMGTRLCAASVRTMSTMVDSA